MAEADGTQYCFRCKGMAVIDKRALSRLPSLLNLAAKYIVDPNSAGPPERDIPGSLRRYAIMIEGMSDD